MHQTTDAYATLSHLNFILVSVHGYATLSDLNFQFVLILVLHMEKPKSEVCGMKVTCASLLSSHYQTDHFLFDVTIP